MNNESGPNLSRRDFLAAGAGLAAGLSLHKLLDMIDSLAHSSEGTAELKDLKHSIILIGEHKKKLTSLETSNTDPRLGSLFKIGLNYIKHYMNAASLELKIREGGDPSLVRSAMQNRKALEETIIDLMTALSPEQKT